MQRSMFIAATGMDAQSLNIDVISNNLANVNTTGFKRSRADFQELMYRTMQQSSLNGDGNAALSSMGLGSEISNTDKLFLQGELKATENPLDVAIQGKGFFEVSMPDGSYAYTRDGSLKVNTDGVLVDHNGYPINPVVQIPSDATDITFNANGLVYAKVANEVNPIEVGQLVLSDFINPSGLTPQGGNLYKPSAESGPVNYSNPTEDGFGSLTQGYLESSNVELVQEMLSLILAQRAYEINSKVVQASDEMLSLANNMRR